MKRRGIQTLDQGATSHDYLRSLDRWTKDVLSRSEKIARLSYPLYFLTAMSAVWSAWNKHIGNIPLFALIIVGVAILLMYYFSDKIYKWDVRLMYGGVFGKLEETITGMEKLKQE